MLVLYVSGEPGFPARFKRTLVAKVDFGRLTRQHLGLRTVLVRDLDVSLQVALARESLVTGLAVELLEVHGLDVRLEGGLPVGGELTLITEQGVLFVHVLNVVLQVLCFAEVEIDLYSRQAFSSTL